MYKKIYVPMPEGCYLGKAEQYCERSKWLGRKINKVKIKLESLIPITEGHGIEGITCVADNVETAIGMLVGKCLHERLEYSPEPKTLIVNPKGE